MRSPCQLPMLRRVISRAFKKYIYKIDAGRFKVILLIAPPPPPPPAPIFGSLATFDNIHINIHINIDSQVEASGKTLDLKDKGVVGMLKLMLVVVVASDKTDVNLVSECQVSGTGYSLRLPVPAIMFDKPNVC